MTESTEATTLQDLLDQIEAHNPGVLVTPARGVVTIVWGDGGEIILHYGGQQVTGNQLSLIIVAGLKEVLAVQERQSPAPSPPTSPDPKAPTLSLV